MNEQAVERCRALDFGDLEGFIEGSLERRWEADPSREHPRSIEEFRVVWGEWY